MGASFTAGGMYAALVTMLVESSLPYAVSYILYIALWAARNPAVLIFTPILASTQVRVILTTSFLHIGDSFI